MSNNMFFLVAGLDELDHDQVLCMSDNLNEVIEFVRHKPISPYQYDWLAIYQCNHDPVHIRFLDGKILLD